MIFILFSSYIFVLFNPMMEIDAMQYASISRELLRGDNILHIFDNGSFYLDKPPLIFWCSALFFKIFGASDIVYRLPSLLFSLLTIYSTFKFSRLYYSKEVAYTATVVLSSCIGLCIMNGDVRTEIYMMGPMMTAIWQLDLFFKNNKWRNLVLSCIAISFAMMGKGPLGMVIPLAIIGIDLLMKKKINLIFDIKLFAGILIIIFCLLPMSYGLYTQFGFYGLEFFYWTQSFGRITGASGWSNNTGPFYLFNVFLYSFLPWTGIFIWSFFRCTKDLLFRKWPEGQIEIVSCAGFCVPLVMLSLSNYKLPHYIYCVFPFASILTSIIIVEYCQHVKTYLRIYLIQVGISIFMLIFIFGLVSYVFPPKISFFFIPLIILMVFGYWHLYSKNDNLVRLLIPSVAISILFNYAFNIGFIKPLMNYQSQSKAAKYLKSLNADIDSLYFYKDNKTYKSRSFNFYLDLNTKYINNEYFQSEQLNKPMIIYTNEEGYNSLLQSNQSVEILKIFEHTRISKLKKNFFNPENRKSILKKKFLLKLS